MVFLFQPFSPTIAKIGILSILFWGGSLSASLGNEGASIGAFVGKINVPGFRTRSFCTGFLVEGGHVLTARHCIPTRENDLVYFVRGYEQGDYLDVLKVPAKDFRLSSTNDFAILCDAKPSIQGFKILEHQAHFQNVLGVSGYGIPSAHKLTYKPCQMSGSDNAGNFFLNCEVSSGTSGGPVIMEGSQGEPSVLGLMSASGSGISKAVRITPSLVSEFCEVAP